MILYIILFYYLFIYLFIYLLYIIIVVVVFVLHIHSDRKKIEKRSTDWANPAAVLSSL